jgi:hypothetical protein
MWSMPSTRTVDPAMNFGNGAPSRRPFAAAIGSMAFSTRWSKAEASSTITTATVMRRYARAALPPSRCSIEPRKVFSLMVSSLPGTITVPHRLDVAQHRLDLGLDEAVAIVVGRLPDACLRRRCAAL